MTIERWDPFREMVSLRDAVNSLLQESFVPPTGARAERGAVAFTLPLDVTEWENDFVVKASLAGVKPEDVQTTILGDTLTIRGESKADEERKGQNWLVQSVGPALSSAPWAWARPSMRRRPVLSSRTVS